MAQSKPKHEWMGTIVIGPHEIGCRLYPAFGKAVAPTLQRVHKSPCSPPALSKKKSGKPAEAKGWAKKSGFVQDQPFCTRCHKPLTPDEISWMVKTPRGIEVPLITDDLERLDFETSKRVTTEIVSAKSATLAALDTGGRRLYACPQPMSVEAYWTAYEALEQTRAVGFIPLLATKTDRGYVAIVRPLVIPSKLFYEGGGEREVLVVDCLADTDELKDPRELPEYPGRSKVSPELLKETIKAINGAMSEEIADPERCVNPRTAKVLRMMERARNRQRLSALASEKIKTSLARR